MVKTLRKLRKDTGLTMKELGKIVGVSESAISQYETGKRDPDHNTLQIFSDVFNVSTDYLLGRTDQKEKLTPVSESELSDKDARLLAWFHSLPPEKRQAILTVGDGPEGLA